MTSIARHHNEWLSLLEISGPFLSLPVLLRVFPQGLEALDHSQSSELRLAYDEWLDNQAGLRPEPAIHTLWVRYVLEHALGFTRENIVEGQAILPHLKATIAEQGETLRPDLVIGESNDAHTPRLLVQIYPYTLSLDKVLSDRRWKATPAMRMMELLRASGVQLGLVTNGEQWMLVNAPRGETSAFVSWYASLWFEEPLTLRAFCSLLGVVRFFSVAQTDTLEGMLQASVNEQQEVTDQLGYQVRRAVEVLIRAVDKADQDLGRKLFYGLGESELYEAALTVMMRLVFLFSAEERGLLLLGEPLYDQNYAVSTLRAQLRETADQQGEEVLQWRFDAWCRLLATFRAVYSGIQHDRLNLPAYGGSLFNPNRFPFLEGRSSEHTEGEAEPHAMAEPLPISNRTVLHLLEALQILRVKVPGGGPAEARRLSFRALDVEQIGHVYEGLLDHVALRATEPVLGLSGTRDKEPEIPLSALVTELGKGETSFIEYLKDATGRSESALKKAWRSELDAFTAQHFKIACNNDDAVFQQVQPFAGLVREDDFGLPAVFPAGSVYVTAGATRRATGTHYTPRGLTEPIVQHTLERLVETWDALAPLSQIRIGVGGEVGYLQITPDGKPATGRPGETIIPRDDEERLILARRLVADRCIYGVDKNPLAVEIAKLSIWLTTMDKGRPFTFLDHALKCGDSLVGASEDDYLRWAHGWHATEATLFDAELHKHLELARGKRRQLEAFTIRDVRDTEQKAGLLKEAEAAMWRVKVGCNLLTGSCLLGLSEKEVEDLQVNLLFPYMAGEEETSELARASLVASEKERAFHWEFEFPEVFEQGGFSAFVGNPPFMGGRKIREALGDAYREALYQLYRDSSGNADYCAFFFLRGFFLLNTPGTLGLIATNTIAQGDTRQTGIDRILMSNIATIYRANINQNWPGLAAVTVNIVNIAKNIPKLPSVLNDSYVDFISNLLDTQRVAGEPEILKTNQDKSFQGSVVVGSGFVLEPREALQLISNDQNKDVIKPYLVGADLNSSPIQEPSRWIINFFDLPIEEASKYSEPFQVIFEKVYPFRLTVNREAHRKYWWHYGDKRPALYKAIASSPRVLVCGQVSKYLSFVFVPNGYVYDQKLVVFTFDEYREFSILQSNIHGEWAWKYSSTMRNAGISYSPTDVFYTFPFPLEHSNSQASLNRIGEQYHEYRCQTMLSRQQGLTGIYNRFHNLKEKASDIARLRELHVEMDNTVAAAYGWQDLDLGHGFHETPQGVRYTISEAARREVLSRLLQHNHERYEEEVKQGLYEKKGSKKQEGAIPKPNARRSAQRTAQLGLLIEPEPVVVSKILTTAPHENPTPTEQIGDWDQCVCLGCGKHLVGFSVTEHTKTAHRGKDPGYRKVSR